MTELIATRAVQGIGAGGSNWRGAQAIIGDVVLARQRGRYMGYFGAVFGLTSVIGPLAGGFFTQHLVGGAGSSTSTCPSASWPCS